MRVRYKALAAGAALVTLVILFRHDGPSPIPVRESRDTSEPQKPGPPTTPAPADHLRVVFLLSNGSVCANARYALVAPGDARTPIALGEADEHGSADLWIQTELPLRLLAFKRMEGEGLLWADEPVNERTGLLNITLPIEASIEGAFLEDRQPVPSSTISVTFGWRKGMDDPLYQIFNTLVGAERTLRLKTDSGGRFSMSTFPTTVFLGFQQLSSERGPYRYRIETNLARHRATCHAAPAPSRYSVTITRFRNPAVRLTVRTRVGASLDETLVTVRIQQHPTEPEDHWVFSGRANKEGRFDLTLAIADSDDPAAFSGRPVWVALFHPAIGVCLAERSLDVSSWSLEIELLPSAVSHSVHGTLVGDGEPREFEGILRSELFPGLDLMRVRMDDRKEFSVDGLAVPSSKWPLDLERGLYRIEVQKNGHAVRWKSTNRSEASLNVDDRTQLEVCPDGPK